MIWARRQYEGRLQREPVPAFEPCWVIFKGCGFTLAADARPQPAYESRLLGKIHVDQSFAVHAYFFAVRGIDDVDLVVDVRMRFGRCSSSRWSPVESWRISASSASRLVIPKRKSTVAYVPIWTPGSPFSTLARVGRVMAARSAIVAVAIRRRSRASRISEPSFRSARTTGRGKDGPARRGIA